MGQLAKTPVLKRYRRSSDIDSSLSSDKSEEDENEAVDEDDDDDDDEEELFEEDDDLDGFDDEKLEANISYEFTNFMNDPGIKEGESKATIINPANF